MVLTGEASHQAASSALGERASFVGQDLAAVVEWIVADRLPN